MSTEKNLLDAFAGESQANRKYLAFAKKAEEDGFKAAAKMFRAAAEAETIHAHSHLKVLDGVKDTKTNLQAGIDGETHEFESMYPEFIKQAEAEGHTAAIATFKKAMEAERVHANLYKMILDNLSKDQDIELYLCPVCGNVEVKRPEKCSICGVNGSRFVVVE
jgi:rubrerythrin